MDGIERRNGVGFFWHPEHPTNRVAGSFSWNVGERASVELAGGETLFRAETQRSNLLANSEDLIVGEVPGLGALSLLNCLRGRQTYNAFGKSSVISCQFAMVGHPRLSRVVEKLFRRMRVEMPALGYLLNTRPIGGLSGNPSSWKLDRRSRTWKAADGLDITLKFDRHSIVGARRASVEMVPVAIFAHPKPQAVWWWFENWLAPLQRLVTVGTALPASATSIQAWARKRPNAHQRRYEKCDLLGTPVRSTDHSSKALDLLFRVDDFDRNPDGLVDVLDGQRRLGADHGVFEDIVVGALHDPDRNLRYRYVDVVSGLETFHSTSFGKAPIEPEEFKSERKRALATLRASDLDPETQMFIKRWLASHANHSLEKRLTDLRTSTGAASTVSESEIAKVRNLLAHGEEVDFRRLRDCHDHVVALSRRVVLHELGMG